VFGAGGPSNCAVGAGAPVGKSVFKHLREYQHNE